MTGAVERRPCKGLSERKRDRRRRRRGRAPRPRVRRAEASQAFARYARATAPSSPPKIAVGLLLSALHLAGLATLTHTPSPMGFLREVLGRPVNERAYVVVLVGYPADGSSVPDLRRKPLMRSWSGAEEIRSSLAGRLPGRDVRTILRSLPATSRTTRTGAVLRAAAHRGDHDEPGKCAWQRSQRPARGGGNARKRLRRGSVP